MRRRKLFQMSAAAVAAAVVSQSRPANGAPVEQTPNEPSPSMSASAGAYSTTWDPNWHQSLIPGPHDHSIRFDFGGHTHSGDHRHGMGGWQPIPDGYIVYALTDTGEHQAMRRSGNDWERAPEWDEGRLS